MRRRLTLAMILMVLATLVLSGLTSLLLAAHSADTQTRRELVHEGEGLAVALQADAQKAPGGDPARALRNLLVALSSPLRLDGSTVVGVRPGGALFDPARPALRPVLPSGITPADLHSPVLYSLQIIAGRAGPVVYAAVPYRASIQIRGLPRQTVQAVVLARTPPSAWAVAGRWFILSSVGILIVAALVAARLGRRFVRPLRDARIVTTRIAAGDLDARVPVPAGSDPELAELAASVNAMAGALEAAKAAERHFLQSVSHDLRTPLTSIRGFAEAIEDGATADSAAAAGVIAAEARRLERLVGDLLALATLEARRFTLQPQPLDLTTSVAETAAGFGPAAAELGLHLTLAPAPPCPVTADADRLAQVTANLIENALRYAATSVAVAVRPGPHGTGAELWVSDDGPGIAPAELPRVFERLFVARPRPDRPIGSGLGLTIVAELVRAMGGTVRVDSPTTAGGGTRMVVALPGASRPAGGGTGAR